MLNLVMQIEEIGLNCSNWNETGPTTKDDPGCVAVDPSQEWCYATPRMRQEAFVLMALLILQLAGRGIGGGAARQPPRAVHVGGVASERRRPVPRA